MRERSLCAAASLNTMSQINTRASEIRTQIHSKMGMSKDPALRRVGTLIYGFYNDIFGEHGTGAPPG